MRIKLMPDFECSPIWIVSDGPSRNVPIDELQIDRALCDRLQEWDQRFQSTFNPSYPPDSGFSSPEERATFIADGAALAEQLRRHFDEVEYLPPA